MPGLISLVRSAPGTPVPQQYGSLEVDAFYVELT